MYKRNINNILSLWRCLKICEAVFYDLFIRLPRSFCRKVLTNFVSLAVYDTKEMRNWSKNLLRRFFKCKFSNAKRKEKRIVTFFTTHSDGEMMKTVIKMIIMVRCHRRCHQQLRQRRHNSEKAKRSEIIYSRRMNKGN